MKTKAIVIMLTYARSGGTLLNRCLASLPDTLMLSEVNIEALCPNSCSNLKDQASNWYGLTLHSDGFLENIEEIYNYCLENGKTLIIRDWSFGSFVPSRYNNFNPSKKLITLEEISKRFPVISFALVRDSIDVWLSFNASPRTFYDKKLEFLYEFSKTLIDNNIKIFRYEDFCRNPEIVIRKICNYANINYSDQFKDFANYFKVTGDIDLPGHSRGIQKGEISLLTRRENYQELSEIINNDTKALIINQMLGY